MVLNHILVGALESTLEPVLSFFIQLGISWKFIAPIDLNIVLIFFTGVGSTTNQVMLDGLMCQGLWEFPAMPRAQK